MTVLSRKLAERARLDGSSVALISDEGTMTWGELASLSFRLSAHLRSRGVRKGDHVTLLCGNRPAYLVCWFAVANLGAVAVTVNTGLVGDSLHYVLRQSGSSFLLVENSLHSTMAKEIVSMESGCGILRFDGENDLRGLLETQAEDAVYEGSGSDPLTIVYTSGTTGLPKGVLNCHQAYLESGRRLVEALQITAADRIMIVLPLFHANPQVYAVMSALETGCALIIRPKFSASRIFDEARMFDATMFTYVGTILAMVAARIPDGDRNHNVTRCVGGGCSPEVWKKMQDGFGIAPHELYGMSETAGWASCNSVEDYRIGSCGKVRDDMELAIVDDKDNIVAHGQVGEIVLRPRQPFRLLVGYWDNPEAMLEASRNFWFHTGDVGRFDEDGFLYFLGRSKEIIRKGGENISPAQLEGAILQFDKVEDAAVVAMPDPIFGDEIKACVVSRSRFTVAELHAHLGTRVPGFMLPRYLQFVDEIPRTETEKIKRKPLQDNDREVIDSNAL
jgi:crotonobetaine/carnitine-CoA ligase